MTPNSSNEPSGSEVATSAVSGALNNTTGSALAWRSPKNPAGSTFERIVDALTPIRNASAATWSCTGGSLSPSFSGPAGDPYAFTPVSCSVTWGNPKSASSEWSGAFALTYGPGCDATHPVVEKQAAGCAITRTTGASGNTRTITGPDGNSYAILHDTNGGGTGWDGSVNPAPSNGGVELTCGSGGCPAQRTLVIRGSHLTGTITMDGRSTKIWDHTVSTDAQGLTVTGTGIGRVVMGSVTVQHNLLKYTSSTTFDSVGYGDATCCFPTTGSVKTTFSKGTNVGKTETLTFGAVCGETTLTTATGVAEPLTLQHCL